ncbi:MAG: hypothetical protein A2104_01985 [Candidatus Melainabacteria bacterium GWF2_32_7]|nr:MAG: hypothetical protein A2104_01985 [Candidatus Melainabacteria bacterium GWF2_32_7]
MLSGFFIFGISFLLVLSSSYFLTTVIKPKKFENSIIYLILILVSQVIISIELLSLLKKVNPDSLIVINFLIFLILFKFWDSKGKPHLDFSEIKLVKNNIIKSIKKDRILFAFSIFFVFSSLISLFLVIFVPSSSPDSLQYHLSRIGMWLQNQTLAHFETADTRQNIYSINSEILILWPMIFLKTSLLAAFLQYFAYFGCIFTLFVFLRYLKISMRRTLWTVFISASLPAAIIESSSTQTNLVVAFFLFVSLYLFIYGVKENNKKALIFSAIAFSIDLGIKYSTFFFVPIFGIIFLLISLRENKKDFYRPIAIFIAASIPAFLVLSSYNHILNFIEFGNFFGNQPYIDRLSAPYTINTFLGNLIRYFLLFIDFTGIWFAKALSPLFLGLKDFLFNIFGLQNTDGLVFDEINRINTLIHESYSKFGLLGFLLLVPLIFKYSLIKLRSTTNKTYYISLFGLITVGFILTISVFMGFCIWNNRFLLTPVIISCAVFAFSYTKKTTILKLLIAFIVIFNFLVVPTFNKTKPFFGVCKILTEYNFVSLRNELRFIHEDYFPEKYNHLYNTVKYLSLVAPNDSKIGLIFSYNDLIYPIFEENPTWKIHQIRYDLLAKRKNYDDYDFLVISDLIQNSEILSYKDVNFNYYIRENGLVTNFDGTRPITLYKDKTGRVITSGLPVMQNNLVNLSSIPNNFKLIKNYKVIEEPNDREKTYGIRKTYIYKRVY